MTKLLVSVRSADEAELAAMAGADLVDVKEPSRGPLGAADAAVLAAVVERLGNDAVPISAALGELVDWNSDRGGLIPPGVSYAKFGLARCAIRESWQDLWRDALARLPLGVSGVAVAYADWQAALAPPALEVLDAATQSRCGVILVDTYNKAGPGLCELWSPRELAALVDRARDCGLSVALAGSVSLASLPQLVALEPDYVGVRGAACRGGRAGALDRALVRELVELVGASARALI